MTSLFEKLGKGLVLAEEAAGRDVTKGGGTVAVIRLEGAIMADSGKGGLMPQGSLNLKSLKDTIKAQFNQKGIVAVALSINSPGGSPVQSDLIAREIRGWADKKKIPVFTFVEDVAASGGYWLACAGDEIYALPSSITGSIGVISAGFGFDKLIEKFGVERRVYTAGDNKSKNDPFSPVKPEDVAKTLELQADIHEDFKAWVKSRRGKKLTQPDNVLMGGDYWTSRKAKEYGLIDGIGEMEATLRQKFGENVQIIYPKAPAANILKMLMGGGLGASAQAASTGSVGADIVDRTLHQAEVRTLWARYGL